MVPSLTKFAWSSFLPKKPPKKPDPTPSEEEQNIIDLARQFDTLVKVPGWLRVLEFGAERVNRELSDAATTKPEQFRLKTNRVVRWDAQRELLDAMQAHVDTTMAERDRILENRRLEEQEYDTWQRTMASPLRSL